MDTPNTMRDKCSQPVQKKSRHVRTLSHETCQKRLVFKDEKETVRLEITAVHKAYLAMIKEKDDEIEALKKNMMTLSNLFTIDMDNLQSEHDSIQDDLDTVEDELCLVQTSEKEWIGRTLKMKFILDEIKKVGALPKDHADWVFPMVDDITIPDVSINIRDEFVPTAQTDNIDWVDDEDGDDVVDVVDVVDLVDLVDLVDVVDLVDLVDVVDLVDLVDGMSDTTMGFTDDEEEDGLDEFGSMMNIINSDDTAINRWRWIHTIHYYGLPRAILERNATRIQSAWREHRIRKCAEGIRIRTIAASKIQSAWRDYCHHKMMTRVCSLNICP